jgi:YesN/AraC family two-component response regulator
MLATKGFKINELKFDDKLGSFSRMSCDAAKTHYSKMIKSGSGEESKAVMFGLPLKISEQEIGAAVMKIYSNITALSDKECENYGIPAGLPTVKETDFDIQIKDGNFASGDAYRMAYITCPDERIFDYDEAWRTSEVFNNRGKASVLQKKISKKHNEANNERNISSLGAERKFLDEANLGEGQVDYTAEETNFGQAGIASTPQAFQRDLLAHEQINTLKKQLDTLTKSKMEALSQEDIQGMITCSQAESVKNMDGKISNMNDQLSQINDAYADLVKIETERMATFREAVANLKEAILNTKIPESRKEEMFKKVSEMKASMSQEAKDEMKVMMESVMNTTHQLAVEAAAEQVEVMAKMVESNLMESADAREETSRNVRALMGGEVSAEGSDLSGRKRAASAVGMAEGSSKSKGKVARAKGGSQGGSSSSPSMPNTPSPVVATRSTRHSSAC